MTTTITPAHVDAWLRTKGRPIVERLIKAREHAKKERARVQAYILPIFNRYEFYTADDMRGPGETRERITDENQLYLTDLDSDLYKQYCAECARAHRENGFTGPEGNCPALMAEHEALKAGWALLASWLEMAGMKPDTFVPIKTQDDLFTSLIGAVKTLGR